jgi:hypothetical protein
MCFRRGSHMRAPAGGLRFFLRSTSASPSNPVCHKSHPVVRSAKAADEAAKLCVAGLPRSLVGGGKVGVTAAVRARRTGWCLGAQREGEVRRQPRPETPGPPLRPFMRRQALALVADPSAHPTHKLCFEQKEPAGPPPTARARQPEPYGAAERPRLDDSRSPAPVTEREAHGHGGGLVARPGSEIEPTDIDGDKVLGHRGLRRGVSAAQQRSHSAAIIAEPCRRAQARKCRPSHGPPSKTSLVYVPGSEPPWPPPSFQRENLPVGAWEVVLARWERRGSWGVARANSFVDLAGERQPGQPRERGRRSRHHRSKRLLALAP